VEHGDRVIDPHVGVEQDFSAFHKGGVYGLRPPPACLMRAEPLLRSPRVNQRRRGDPCHTWHSWCTPT
jgi:hypothetical protein